MGMVDLHIHSTYSDGTLTPSEIVKKAESIGLEAVALTDHDTVSGLKEFLSCESHKVEKVPGVEISVQLPEFSFHMVGLFVDDRRGELEERLSVLKRAREERNHKIVKILNEHGFSISMDELKEIAGEQLGRPHIAHLLHKKGYFSSPKEAFEKCLKKGAFAYVDKFRFSPEVAIDMIKRAGGISIIAHPGLINISRDKLVEFIKEMKELGVDGIEVFYSDHTLEDTEFFMKIAKDLGLVISGGSDFHGDNKKGIELGRGRDNLEIDAEIYRNLLKYHACKTEM